VRLNDLWGRSGLRNVEDAITPGADKSQSSRTSTFCRR
jgi:hypothetical protein